MTLTAKKIKSEFQALPVEDLIALNAEIVRTIYQRDEKLSADELGELQRRADSVLDGTARHVDAFEALAQM